MMIEVFQPIVVLSSNINNPYLVVVQVFVQLVRISCTNDGHITRNVLLDKCDSEEFIRMKAAAMCYYF